MKTKELKPVKKLIVGKRYWLDSMLDTSAVFVGYSQKGNPRFKELMGVDCYLTDADNLIPMPIKGKYFLANQSKTDQK